MVVSVVSCINDDTIPTEPSPIISNPFVQVFQEGTIEDVTSRLETTLTEKGFNLPPFSPIQHDIAASNVNLELRPTRLFVFGNPNAGTLLMQEDQRIGIDLPLKMLAFTDASDRNILGFYTATTLARRYDITNTQLLTRIDSTLIDISGLNISTPILIREENAPPLQEKESAQDLETTIAQLRTAITSREFTIIGEVAHDQAAASVDLELRPTRVLIFGKPEGGTLLMQSDQRVGIDLPLKVLVYEDENGVIKVAHYGSDFLAQRYALTDKTQVLDNINSALAAITDDAIM